MDYDVLILGGGLTGCAVAYELSKYNLNIALIERDYDIADDLAPVNSSIVFDGMQCENNIMSKLQFIGNNIIEELANKFNIPHKNCDCIIIPRNKTQEEYLKELYDKSVKKEFPNIDLLDGNYVHEIEPNLNLNVKNAVYTQNTAVISPYDLGIAYGEIAFDNGVSFRLEEVVEDIKKVNKGFRVVTNKNKFSCRMVINTTPEDYNIYEFSKSLPKESGYLKYFLIEKEFKGGFNNIVFSYNENNEFICAYPTVRGNYIAVLKANTNINYEESYREIASLVHGLTFEDISGFYEAPFFNEDVIIDDSLVNKGYIKVTGKNYAEVTMAPSIAKIIRETVESNLKCKLKSDFNDKRREIYKFRDMTNKERNKLIKLDKRYGKMVCVCNKVTEGEIVDAIRRPLGARTLEGIKRRTGACSGSCKGAYCTNKVVSILAREINKSMTDIVKDSKNSKILLNRIKEFDEI